MGKISQWERGIGVRYSIEANEILRNAGAKRVFGLDDILTSSVNGSGYNEKWGLLGSNKSTEEKIKLFPRNCKPLVDDIQNKVYEKTGKKSNFIVSGIPDIDAAPVIAARAAIY